MPHASAPPDAAQQRVNAARANADGPLEEYRNKAQDKGIHIKAITVHTECRVCQEKKSGAPALVGGYPGSSQCPCHRGCVAERRSRFDTHTRQSVHQDGKTGQSNVSAGYAHVGSPPATQVRGCCECAGRPRETRVRFSKVFMKRHVRFPCLGGITEPEEAQQSHQEEGREEHERDESPEAR